MLCNKVCCSFIHKQGGLAHSGFDKIYNHFVRDICIFIFFFANCCIPIQISHKFVASGLINNNIALVQIMAWCQTGDKWLSEPKLSQINMTAQANRKQGSDFSEIWGRKMYNSTNRVWQCFDPREQDGSQRFVPNLAVEVPDSERP